jgi:hypothetical protein
MSHNMSFNQEIITTSNNLINNDYFVKRISEENIQKQQESFNRLLQNLEKGDDAQIDTVLSEREFVASEEQLEPDLQEQLFNKLQKLK